MFGTHYDGNNPLVVVVVVVVAQRDFSAARAQCHDWLDLRTLHDQHCVLGKRFEQQQQLQQQ